VAFEVEQNLMLPADKREMIPKEPTPRETENGKIYK
jgi:hypothetical protein